MINNFETELKNKNLQFTVIGDRPNIVADRERINQVLMSLISNAVKYAPDGGEIKITILEAEDSVIFSIEDNGIGIPGSEIPYIFERFYRADKSRNRMTGGSGIGLAIVKSIVEAHGGIIDVESRLSRGSCLIITLPKSN